MKCFVLLVLVACAVSIARGQAEVYRANGTVIKGNVVEGDGEKVKVALIAESDTRATVLYGYEQLAPQTIYRLQPLV